MVLNSMRTKMVHTIEEIESTVGLAYGLTVA